MNLYRLSEQQSANATCKHFLVAIPLETLEEIDPVQYAKSQLPDESHLIFDAREDRVLVRFEANRQPAPPNYLVGEMVDRKSVQGMHCVISVVLALVGPPDLEVDYQANYDVEWPELLV